MYENIKIILGSIAYPKSEALIIPSNQSGLMTRGQVVSLVADGGSAIAKEAKKAAQEGKVQIGDCFVTGVGRLRKRGVKKLYHAVIKRFPSDLTSITFVTDAINTSIKKAIMDGNTSITICGIGIDTGELDIFTVSRIIISTCEKHSGILFRIIDSNKDFINEVNKLVESKNGQ
jgi:O-acetyl-ADP-ribose deacetylase (regulator of RNase III)